MRRQRASNCALTSSFFFFSSSVSLSCCTAYSSMGSTMKSTSRPRFLRRSMKGEFSTAFVDAQLEILPEGLVELVEVVLVLGDLGEHLQALLDDVLLDDLKDLVLLQHLTGDVERKVLGVDDTLDETEPLGDDVLAVVHDEDAAHVQLDVVRLLLAVKHVEGRALGHEEHALERELALDGEVLHREVVLPVVGEGLVEGGVLVAGDLVGGAHPDGLLLVHQVPLVAHLLHGLLLLLLLLVLGADLLDL